MVGKENALAFAQLWRALPSPCGRLGHTRLVSLQGQSHADNEQMAEFHVNCANLSIVEGKYYHAACAAPHPLARAGPRARKASVAVGRPAEQY